MTNVKTVHKNKYTRTARAVYDYDRRVARLKRARGALLHHGARLTRTLSNVRKERERAILHKH